MQRLRPTSSAYVFFRAAAFSTAIPSLPCRRLPSDSIYDLLEKVRLLSSYGQLDEALSLFYTIEVPHTNQTYAHLFQACALHGCLRHGRALHHHLLASGSSCLSDSSIYLNNHVMNMYAKCGELDNARQLFDEMPIRNIVSWTALISGYAQHNRPNECLGLFSSMVACHRPTEFAYASVLTMCDGDRGRQVHTLALKTSFDAYVYVANALITMYWKSCVYHDDDRECGAAWRIFKNMQFRGLITWNSMIAGFQSSRMWAEAIGFFSRMRHDGIGFDRATILSVCSSLSTLRGKSIDIVEASLKYCFQLHCLAIKTWYISDTGVATALTKAYSDLGGEVADCYKLFMEISGFRDIVSWTGLITIFAEHDPEKSMCFYSQLCQEGLAPDRHTFSIVLKTCAGLVTESHTSAVHSQIIKSGFEGETVLANALIHAYGRCGSIVLSKHVFDEMRYRDTVSWNSMLKAYGLHGHAEAALKCFVQMNVPHDATTFVALLSACSHAGLVEEGTKIFYSLAEKYGVIPQLDHYACMVDILGRAGRFMEAEKLINEMPMEPDSVVWSALLGACRKHGQIRLADLAANKLKELDPENSLGYVLMSNICCSGGSFSEAGDIRKQMKGLGVRKEPGLSWTEVGNMVQEFASGGLHHPQGEAIRANLDNLVKQLKGLGYVPETSLALHDIEVEDKEVEVNYHSEKLAFVYAIMDANVMPSRQGAIRIVKNIRICVDCHNFMKFACELVQREIVVRDSNRFHHFKDKRILKQQVPWRLLLSILHHAIAEEGMHKEKTWGVPIHAKRILEYLSDLQSIKPNSTGESEDDQAT